MIGWMTLAWFQRPTRRSCPPASRGRRWKLNACRPGDPSVHPTAIVEAGAEIGGGTTDLAPQPHPLGQPDRRRLHVGFAVYVDTGVVIGDRCKIQNHVSSTGASCSTTRCSSVRRSAFTNDLLSARESLDVGGRRHDRRAEARASGPNATIVCGVELGAWSMVGAGPS